MRKTLALLLLAGPAWAQGSPPELDRLLRDPHHREAVLATARQEDAGVVGACPTASIQAGEEVTILQPVQFDSGGKPTAGAWRERLTVLGCGRTRVLNVLTVVRPLGQLATGPLLAGTTHADPVLQRDTVRIAFAAAAATFAGCPDPAIIDTRYVGLEAPPDPTLSAARQTPPWREDWTLRGCNKEVVLPLHFLPDATGTSVRASPPP